MRIRKKNVQTKFPKYRIDCINQTILNVLFAASCNSCVGNEYFILKGKNTFRCTLHTMSEQVKGDLVMGYSKYINVCLSRTDNNV